MNKHPVRAVECFNRRHRNTNLWIFLNVEAAVWKGLPGEHMRGFFIISPKEYWNQVCLSQRRIMTFLSFSAVFQKAHFPILLTDYIYFKFLLIKFFFTDILNHLKLNVTVILVLFVCFKKSVVSSS